jgi:hypothetical protein
MKNRETRKTDANNATREEGPEKVPSTNAPIPEDRIRQRAYEIHQARGGALGRELDDWLQAEREIKAGMQPSSGAQV